jgi:hypothetical protein
MFVVKTDENTLKHIEALREQNKDIQHLINWVEEYSTLNANQKEILTTIKKKNLTSQHPLHNPFTNNFPCFENSPLITDSDYFNNTDFKLTFSTSSNFLNFKDYPTATIEEPSFDLFQFENAVGKENTLSTLSCYIFLSMGLYSFIDYSNFENFLDYITKGYDRNNPYHNDLHAADVEQTSYIYLKHGMVKDVCY